MVVTDDSLVANTNLLTNPLLYLDNVVHTIQYVGHIVRLKNVKALSSSTITKVLKEKTG